MRAASSSTRVVALPTPAPRRSRPPRPRPHRVSRRGASSSDPPIRADADASSNPYDVLGLDVTASTRAVRAAFRARAKDAHPDRGGSAEAFDALARAHELLVDDRRRAELDAELLDQPAGSFALEELRWSRELARLEEEEDAGEVRGADAVLASARAYAAAERALETIAAKKKKAADAAARDAKQAKLDAANARRLEIHARVAADATLRGDDVRVVLEVTRDMLESMEDEDSASVEGDSTTSDAASGTRGLGSSSSAREASASINRRRALAIEAEAEATCPKCGGWGEKEGHWTLAIDKLCPRCDGAGRVAVTRRAEVYVRPNAADGEVVTVAGRGGGGFAKQVNALGGMTEPGPCGDLLVEIAILREGETTRKGTSASVKARVISQ